MAGAASATGPGPRGAWLRRYSRIAALVIGIALAAYFVRSEGFSAVADVVKAAAGWTVVIAALEAAVVLADALAARALIVGIAEGASSSHRTDSRAPAANNEGGPRSASLATWFRATAYANACSVFLPAGRAAGEAARAATLSSSFGASRAFAACAQLQASSLLGTAIASFVLAALIASFVGASHALAPLLLGNAAVCLMLGGGVLLLVRSASVGGWLRRLLARVAPAAPSPETAPSRRASAQAVALCSCGRAIQALQYGVAVLAVGGTLSLRSAVTADGVHIVGATAGDLIPNQVGPMEGAYRYFAEPLGFADAPARALAIALIMHGVQIGLAVVALIIAGLLPRAADAAAAPTPAER